MLVAELADVDRDDLTPLLAVAARDVGDEDRLVVHEERGHLFGEVHLGVVLRAGVRSARLDVDRLLHHLPQVVVDHAVHLVAGDLQHELLERPHRRLGLAAELAVDDARGECELDEPPLQRLHRVAVRSPRQRLVEVRERSWLHHRGRRRRCGRGGGGGGGAGGRAWVGPVTSVGVAVVLQAAHERNGRRPGRHHRDSRCRHQQAPPSDVIGGRSRCARSPAAVPSGDPRGRRSRRRVSGPRRPDGVRGRRS